MTKIDIDNVIKGICGKEHNKELYHDEIDTFCKLMGSTSFAYKVSKRFNVIYNKTEYIFDPYTEDDQLVNPTKDFNNSNLYHARLVDNDMYIILKNYMYTISKPIITSLAEDIVENGIHKLPQDYTLY